MKVVCFSKPFKEVVKTESIEVDRSHEPRIYGLKISLDGEKCYCISVRHTGRFRLTDYEELDFEVNSARLVRRK